jgi:hypothetical protein
LASSRILPVPSSRTYAHWYSIGYPAFYLVLAAGSLVLGLAS